MVIVLKIVVIILSVQKGGGRKMEDKLVKNEEGGEFGKYLNLYNDHLHLHHQYQLFQSSTFISQVYRSFLPLQSKPVLLFLTYLSSKARVLKIYI